MREGNLDFGDPVSKSSKTSNRTVADDLKEENYKAMAQTGIFRKYITDLALHNHDPILATIHAHNLTDMDMVFFKKFINNNLTESQIDAQLAVIPVRPDTEDSIKLLKYMQSKLRVAH